MSNRMGLPHVQSIACPLCGVAYADIFNICNALRRHSRLNGEGDVLYPFYDGQYTAVFTQVGLRSMSGMDNDDRDGRGGDRWIGNFGLGQRWYPGATLSEDGKSVDSGNFMLGYNFFFDNDFTRSHQRGGIGIEGQYDWLHLASNYYFPLSGWKGSYDFDSRFVQERPAEGWDVRVKGYLPFYRNVAITGAYTQWYGDHVGMFSSRELEKDPKVWSYGVEYTPFPLLTGFVNQRSTTRGEQDTEFGLRMTYHFNMPWDDQVSHSKVQQIRTVADSRHEFVDRENRIILEYRAKNNYQIEFVGRSGDVFTFRLKHPLDGIAAGKTVRVSASGVTTLAEHQTAPTGFFASVGDFLGDLFSVSTAYAADLYNTYVTDRNGEFRVTITGLLNTSTVTVQAGEASRTFTAAELGGGTTSAYITVDSYSDGSNFAAGQSTASVTVKVTNADGTPIVDGTAVTWLVEQAQNNSPAMYTGWGAKKTGLTWGATADLVYYNAVPELLTAAPASTTTNGLATVQLTDIVGERVITLRATAQVDGADRSITQAVSFGNGPLSVFRAPDGTTRNWRDAYQYCNNVAPSGDDDPANWGSVTPGDYHGGGKLPKVVEYQAVSSFNSTYNPNGNAKGAAYAAGWPDDYYWTGEANDTVNAFFVYLDDGYDHGSYVGSSTHVACRRQP